MPCWSQCVCVLARPHAPVCVCVCVRALATGCRRCIPRLCHHPTERTGAQDCRGAGSSHRALVQGGGQAGGKLGSVSVSQAVWRRRPAACTRTCACLPLCWLGGGGRKGCPLPTCPPTSHPWPLAPAHHLVPYQTLLLPLPVALGKPPLPGRWLHR